MQCIHLRQVLLTPNSPSVLSPLLCSPPGAPKTLYFIFLYVACYKLFFFFLFLVFPLVLACNRSFFGLTALGQGNVFENAKANKLQRLTSIPVEEYVNTFAEMSLESTNPALAEEIRVDGKMFMKRQELPQLIERVLGEKPDREELDAFLTFFDITATGIMDSMEFGNGLRNMLARASNPANPKHYTSANRLRADRKRHRRLDEAPQTSYAKPLLASQVYGWHTQQAQAGPEMGNGRKYFPIFKTDVTLNEGRSVTDYFGEF